MAKILRNRVIRPSTRLQTSKSYKIDTKNVLSNDILEVYITHESDENFHKVFIFQGSEIAHRNSISFRVYEYGNIIDILWSIGLV